MKVHFIKQNYLQFCYCITAIIFRGQLYDMFVLSYQEIIAGTAVPVSTKCNFSFTSI